MISPGAIAGRMRRARKERGIEERRRISRRPRRR
jgi:hypothetical protein